MSAVGRATGLPRRPPTASGITERDAALVHAAWSFGYLSVRALHALVLPDRTRHHLYNRLRVLCTDGYLERLRYAVPNAALFLYSAGPSSLRPGSPRPWRPSVGQLQHTLDVGDAVVALSRSGFAGPVCVTGWQGEAELRSWALPGQPYPDAKLTYHCTGRQGAWLVELDRGTEGRSAWGRKLARYAASEATGLVLVLTTTRARAKNIAVLAAELGVALLSTTTAAVTQEPDPHVFDARCRDVLPLSLASRPAG